MNLSCSSMTAPTVVYLQKQRTVDDFGRSVGGRVAGLVWSAVGVTSDRDDVRRRRGGELAHGLGELAVAAGVGVLVDHRGPDGRVAESVLQLSEAGAGLGCDGGAGVP